MKRLAVLLSRLLASALLLYWARPAFAAESHEVLLLEPEGYPHRWLEAEHRVVAELETSGFRVVRREVHAANQEALMRALLNSGPSFASFVMVREGAGGAAFVWLSGTARIKRFAMSDVSSSLAAGAIALRVNEYLNMQVLTIAVPPPSQTEEREAARTRGPTMTPRAPDVHPAPRGRTSRTGWLWLGPSAVLSSDSDSIAAAATLGIGQELTEHISVGASADWLALPLEVRTSSGTTQVTGTSARLLGEFFAPLGTRWRFSLGLGAGLLRLASRSEAAAGFRAEQDSTSTSLLAARGRLSYRAPNGFSLMASLDPALAVPQIRIRSDQRELARLGRPWFTSTLGAGWAF